MYVKQQIQGRLKVRGVGGKVGPEAGSVCFLRG